MKVNSESGFFKWLGAASVGTFIGLAAGAAIGLLTGGGLGGWFWYAMRTDGFNALSDDTENLFGFCLMVGLALAGVLVGVVIGGLAGLVASSIYSAIGGGKNAPAHGRHLKK